MPKVSEKSFWTATQVANLRVPRPPSTRVEYRDRKTPGLALRITDNDVRTWCYWLKDPRTGAWKRKTIGRYAEGQPGHLSLADTRLKAAQLRTLADPFSESNGERLTVKKLGEKYIERHAKPKKKSWAEDERRLKKHVYPKLGDTFAEKVARGDIANLLHRIHARAPIEANRTLALLRKVFRFGIAVGDLEISPVTHVPSPAKEKARSRVLNEAEIRSFWLALDGVHFSEATSDALRLQLLLGARSGEVTGLPVGELEFENDPPLWRLPSERAKAGIEILRPLPPAALAIIRRRMDETKALQKQGKVGRGNPFIFVTALAPDAALTPRAVWRAVDRAQQDKRVEIPNGFTPHDLRRSCRTFLAKLGVSETVAKKILGIPRRSLT